MNKERLSSIFILVTALFFSYGIWWHPWLTENSQAANMPINYVIAKLTLLPIAVNLLFYMSSKWTNTFIEWLTTDAFLNQKLTKYDKYSYLIFWPAGIVFILGIKVNLTSYLILFAAFLLLKIIILFSTMGSNHREKVTSSMSWLAILFSISGFAALIYQIVWQRILFTTFGVNIESVTVIVSLFMLGLGIGALVGGVLSHMFKDHLIKMFCAAEVAIGLFGFFSIDVIRFVDSHLQTTSLLNLSMAVYATLAIPTLLMGATLPLLVTYLNRHFHNIGQSVGLLYAFNTFGSAIAAFLTVKLLFVEFGLTHIIIIAASCNILTAVLVYFISRHREAISAPPSHAPSGTALSFPLALLLSGAIGYLSLSQEIIWFRILGFSSANAPDVFGLVLCAFLTGIGFGSLRSKKICESGKDLVTHISRALILSTIIYYFSFPIMANISQNYTPQAGMIFGYCVIVAIAFLTGSIFPTLCHMGISSEHSKSGSALSKIYFANIVGATLGPLLTGFVLLEYFSLTDNVAIITALSGAVAIIFTASKLSFKLTTPIVMLCIVALTFHTSLFHRFLEKTQYQKVHKDSTFKYTLESRSGIITVLDNPKTGDIIFGGGIYDGRFNTNPVIKSNFIQRMYMMAALHPKPKRVLEIGLSSGSWAKVVASYSDLVSLDSIEINKGYLKVIERYPAVSSILNDKKVNIHIDDGRRWLNNYSGEKFDFIVMNTTFYWRANASNVLSADFLQLCKKHLNANGVIFYNTTGSQDVAYTAAHHFKYITMVNNFVAASDSPFSQSYQQKINNLLKFKDDNNKPIFKNEVDNRFDAKLIELASWPLEDIRDELLNKSDLWLITDDNMASEYKTKLKK